MPRERRVLQLQSFRTVEPDEALRHKLSDDVDLERSSMLVMDPWLDNDSVPVPSGEISPRYAAKQLSDKLLSGKSLSNYGAIESPKAPVVWQEVAGKGIESNPPTGGNGAGAGRGTDPSSRAVVVVLLVWSVSAFALYYFTVSRRVKE